MACIVCKKTTNGTMGPSHTRIPVCSDCTSDWRQRTSRDSTNFKDPHRICPDCGGRKGWKSKRCSSCALKLVKKIPQAMYVCPRCQEPKMWTSKTCRNCFNNLRNEPDPLENSKEDQEMKP